MRGLRSFHLRDNFTETGTAAYQMDEPPLRGNTESGETHRQEKPDTEQEGRQDGHRKEE